LANALCTIEAESHLSVAETDALWALFAVTFEPLRRRAAARHMLTRDEFDAELGADAVIKLVARDHHGNPVALATMSTKISSFEWINADFYEHRFGAAPVFYVGLVAIDPAHQGDGLLSPLIDALLERVHAGRGVLAFDLCAFNDTQVDLAQKALARARLLAPARGQTLDTQTYYCVSFDDGAEERS
jgi:GNAT superfamily N-acetyltransferase